MTDQNGAEGEGLDPQSSGTPDTNPATQPDGNATGTPNGSGSASQTASDPFAALELDDATREWAKAKGLSKTEDVIRKAYEQEKFIGGAVKIPGEDATPEDLKAFAEKVLPAIAPKDVSAYKFEVPKELPPELPYDEGRANEFKEFAKNHRLTPEQAKAVHDEFIRLQVSDYTGQLEKAPAIVKAQAEQETGKLTKLWGALDSTEFKANAAYADKVIGELGPDVLVAFQKAGLVGPNKEMLSADLGVGFAKIGAALYREADVLRGNADAIGNPFADGPNHNVTAQMRVAKQDPDHARALIAAAGKRPEDFGLRG